MQSQTTIPAQAGGFSGVSVAIPAGTRCARVQPTLADSDWSAATHNFGDPERNMPQREFEDVSEEAMNEMAEMIADRGVELLMG